MTKTMLLTGALTTLLTAGLACAEGGKESAPKDASAQGECHGINACKGTSACATKDSGCHGQNACKGKGWVMMSQKDCKAKKGTFRPHETKH